MADSGTVPVDAVRLHGIEERHERMANGELRFRLMAGDGSGYIRTIASDAGGWQNSHYHKMILETYIVQSGWAGFVELVDGDTVWLVLRSGDVYTTQPYVAHNVYLPANTVLHTVKHGDTTAEADWHGSPELDTLTKSVAESEVLQRGKGSSETRDRSAR
jgi:hypothetical protein